MNLMTIVTMAVCLQVVSFYAFNFDWHCRGILVIFARILVFLLYFSEFSCVGNECCSWLQIIVMWSIDFLKENI